MITNSYVTGGKRVSSPSVACGGWNSHDISRNKNFLRLKGEVKIL